MKHFLLIATMLLSSSLCIRAQEKFYTPGKTWIYHNENTLMPIEDYYYKVSVVGDTVVNGIDATILSEQSLGSNHRSWRRVVYEDNGMIYEFNDDDGLWPLMNFSLHLGDVFYLEEPYPCYDNEPCDDDKKTAMIIADEKTYCIEGIDRRVLTITFRDYDTTWKGYWIEGIGAPNPDFYITEFEFPTDGSVRYLSECYDGDRLIYSKANFDKLVTGIDKVASDKRQREEVYDLMGRRVANPVKGCLYVTSSGKRVW